jgi:VWFA-related protein
MLRPRSLLAFLLFAAPALLVLAQNATPAPEPQEAPVTQPTTTITARSTLVLVPALVRTKSGAMVYTLPASAFTLTDNGVEQKLNLDEDSGSQPLAMVVLVQTGGEGGQHLDIYRTLPTMLDALLSGVQHKVAVVSFDSAPTFVQKFTTHLDRVDTALHGLQPGDDHAAILDAIVYAANLLRRQPPEYRRAILLVSETIDHGSSVPIGDALRAISDTNTVIYSIAFNSGKAEAGSYASRELPTTPGAGGLVNERPNPPNGCMGEDPDLEAPAQTKAAKAYDCLAQLLPPLALAKLAFIAAKDGLRRNTPETVAHLTGGEYFKFSNINSLEKDLNTIANHIPNRYVLSFHPQEPQPGIHALQLTLKDYPDLKVTARSSYWIDDETAPAPAAQKAK